MQWTFKREGPFRMGSVNRFFRKLVSAVQEMLDLVSGRISSMQVEQQSLLDDNRALVERIEALTARSRRLEASEGQAKAELATANAVLLEAKESEKALRRVRSTLETRTANLADNCQRLEEELAATKLAKQALAVELRSRKRAEREAANADPAEEIRTLREQCEALTELRRRLESSESEARAQLAVAKAALREAVESEKTLRNDRSILEANGASLEVTCKRLETELAETKLSRHALEVELRSRKRSEREAVTAAEEARAGFDQLQQEVSHRDRVIESLRVQVSTVEEALDDRDLRLEGVRSDLQRRTEELDRVTQTLAALERRFAKADPARPETPASPLETAPVSPHAPDPPRPGRCPGGLPTSVAPAKDSIIGVRRSPPVKRITLSKLPQAAERAPDARAAGVHSGPPGSEIIDPERIPDPWGEHGDTQDVPGFDIDTWLGLVESGSYWGFGDPEADMQSGAIPNGDWPGSDEIAPRGFSGADSPNPAGSGPAEVLLGPEWDLIGDFPDAPTPTDSLPSGLTRHDRARQVAIEVAGKYDLDESAVGLLTRIFAAHWWSSARQSVEGLLQRRATVRELEIAFEIRTFWADNPEFSSCFNRAGNPIERRIALPWLVALEFVRAYEDGYPDIEEMQEYLLETHDVWAERWPLQDSYPSFLLYFKAVLDSREEGESLPPPQSGGRVP